MNRRWRGVPDHHGMYPAAVVSTLKANRRRDHVADRRFART
jgi:hypothetical protein